MSKKILKKRFQKQYGNVYEKGAVLAFLLDIKINELTLGEKSLRSVLLELSELYGPDKPFKDDEFIGVFVQHSHPDIKMFFDAYISGRKKLPYAEEFKKIGWEYLENTKVPTYSFGFDKNSLAVVEGTEYLVYIDTIQNPLGLKNGDVLLTIEDKPVTTDEIEPLFYLYFVDDNQSVNVKIMRNGMELYLSSNPKEGFVLVDFFLRRMVTETPEMEKLREQLFKVNH